MLFEDPSYSSADSLCEPNPFLDASARLRKKIMKNISDKFVDTLKAQNLFRIFFSPENHAVYEIMFQSMIESNTP
jgi:hypothetical protein